MRRPLREALIVFAISTAATAALYQLGRVVPLVWNNLQAFVAVVFLALPFYVSGRHKEDLSRYGFTTRPLGKSLALGAGVPLVLFPLFAIGFVLFYQQVCAPGAPGWLASLAPPRWCATFDGWDGLAHPRLPRDFLENLFAQVVVVALPEELFFRGYLLARLEEAVPPRRRLLGGGLGWALVLSAVLFAFGHVLVDFDPRRAAVFFPGLLFGWMRSATGSILAGVVAHAASNLFMDALQRTFFG